MNLRPFMTSERIWLGLMLASLAAVALGVWVFLALRVLEPAPLTWNTISPPIVADENLTISAEAIRHGDCSGSPRIDLMDGAKEIRLPVPTREVSGNLSTYQSGLTEPLPPGPYRLRLTEILVCGGTRHEIASPWITFSMPPVSPPA